MFSEIYKIVKYKTNFEIIQYYQMEFEINRLNYSKLAHRKYNNITCRDNALIVMIRKPMVPYRAENFKRISGLAGYCYECIVW